MADVVPLERREARLAWWLCLPALVAIGGIALLPLGWTLWESVHLHDLRMPWRGRPFVGLAHYTEALRDARLLGAVARTAGFAFVSVALELVLGLALALGLHRVFRGRGAARTVALLPWALPTVVAGLVFRFLFEGGEGSGPLSFDVVWFADAWLAWVPIVVADVWKTTPFVALLLLAGLQSIPADLYEAAEVDGAGAWGRFRHVTLPLLGPALLVALIFRTLDALRVFDLVWVLTSGGPGTATEPLAFYAFHALLQELRFGYGSALSVLIFAIAFVLAAFYLRLARASLLEAER